MICQTGVHEQGDPAFRQHVRAQPIAAVCAVYMVWTENNHKNVLGRTQGDDRDKPVYLPIARRKYHFFPMEEATSLRKDVESGYYILACNGGGGTRADGVKHQTTGMSYAYRPQTLTFIPVVRAASPDSPLFVCPSTGPGSHIPCALQ